MIDLHLWKDTNFDTLTAHIKQRYHDVHRVQLRDLIALAEKVNTAHAGLLLESITQHLCSM